LKILLPLIISSEGWVGLHVVQVPAAQMAAAKPHGLAYGVFKNGGPAGQRSQLGLSRNEIWKYN